METLEEKREKKLVQFINNGGSYEEFCEAERVLLATGTPTPTNEEVYDAEIAPELLKLCKRCQELGMPFVAQVEFDRGDCGRGRTEFCPPTTHDRRQTAKCRSTTRSLWSTVQWKF